MERSQRQRPEHKIRRLSESLREEVDVEGAVARVGEELVEGLDRPGLLDRVCRLTTVVLRCDVSWTVLLDSERNCYATDAASGATLEQQEELRLLRLPVDAIAPLLALLENKALLQVVTSARVPPLDPLALRLGSGVTLYVPLRRGGDVIGVLTAGRRGQAEAFSATHQHIARRLGGLASLALEAARLRENAEQANHMKSDFVATMSHELRSPMNVIMGYNDLLRDDAFGPLNDEQRKVFLAMDRSSRKLLDLINDILDVRRLAGGRLPRSIRPMNPRRMLEEVREECRGLTAPNVEIVWKIPSDLTGVRTDAAKVKGIVKGLLQNAVKFTPSGQVTVEARSRRGGLDLSVTDTGIGIPLDARSYIFEPFRQVEHTTTRRFGGVGLGLHLVLRLVDLLEGSVTVESEVGRGSIFKVALNDIDDRRSEWTI
jgi:signal transduction histidine kinase